MENMAFLGGENETTCDIMIIIHKKYHYGRSSVSKSIILTRKLQIFNWH